MKLPMPHEKLDEGIVIASQYQDDNTAEVIVLMPEAPYYRRIDVSLVTGEVIGRIRLDNISEATEGWA